MSDRRAKALAGLTPGRVRPVRSRRAPRGPRMSAGPPGPRPDLVDHAGRRPHGNHARPDFPPRGRAPARQDRRRRSGRGRAPAHLLPRGGSSPSLPAQDVAGSPSAGANDERRLAIARPCRPRLIRSWPRSRLAPDPGPCRRIGREAVLEAQPTLASAWPFRARREQLPPLDLLRTWIFLGGRGAGKTIQSDVRGAPRGAVRHSQDHADRADRRRCPRYSDRRPGRAPQHGAGRISAALRRDAAQARRGRTAPRRCASRPPSRSSCADTKPNCA